MKLISKRQVILLHSKLVAESGGSEEIREEGLLESALAAPYQEFAGVSNYPSIEEKAVRLGYGIIKNHPFLDGNKRTGTHIMLLLLYINGKYIAYEQQELIDVIMNVAAGNVGYSELLLWIKEHEVK